MTQRSERVAAANRLAAAVFPYSVKLIDLQGPVAGGLYVRWKDYANRWMQRRWMTRGQDFYPVWSKCWPGGGTSLTALAQVVRFARSQPVLPLAWWQYVTGEVELERCFWAVLSIGRRLPAKDERRCGMTQRQVLEMADLFRFAHDNGARAANWSRRDDGREVLSVEIRPGVWFGGVWKVGDDAARQAALLDLLDELRELVETFDAEAAEAGGAACQR